MMNSLPSGTVTFLFTDIEGSTKLAREHREVWESARARHQSILRKAIEANQGYVFQVIGDAFCAGFHTAEDALRAAVQSQVDLHSETWGDTPIKVRMGIHTGKADLQEDGQYHGYLAMSRVQRLMSAGYGGQVLISAATQELLLEDLPEDVSLRDLGERRLKDLIRPEHIYQLVIPGLPVDFPPLKTLDAYRHNLPVQLTSFIGREKEMEEIKQAILTHRLITLTGVGGTGKTRLSLQGAADLLDQFPDGVWLVELAPTTNPDLIPQTIISSLRILEQPGLTILQLLNDYLRGKKLLLVLDNCEHLIEACAKLVDKLLSNAHKLHILATSREALGVQGELIWHVPSLSVPDVKQLPAIEQFSQYEAVQLFIERATLVQPHFLVTNDNAPAIAQICFRLDGIPLALELAAARVRALSVDQIAKRLDDRFRLLTGGSRTALERHQTLRATIDWSYNLLSGDEKLLLCRLSIFAGGWTLEAAEQVCAGKNDISSYDVLDLLTHLVDKSLVILDGSRYRMLETTRQYAAEKLFESDEGETLRDQHLAYFLELAGQGDNEIHGPNQLEWLHRLSVMGDNLRAALEWAIETQQIEVALQMARKLHWFWFVRGEHNEGRRCLGRVLAMPDAPLYPEPYAEALTQIAHHTWLQIGAEQARPFVEQALAIARAEGDKRNTAKALSILGLVMNLEHNFVAAQVALEESKMLFQEVHDDWGYAHAIMCLGASAYFQGDDPNTLSLHKQALELFRKLGDLYFQSVALRLISDVQVKQGNWLLAQAGLREALTLAQRLDSKYEIGSCLWSLGYAVQPTGNVVRAVHLYGAAKNLLDSVGAWSKGNVAAFENDIAPCRAALSETEFATALEQGRAMTMEQAIAYALEDNDD